MCKKETASLFAVLIKITSLINKYKETMAIIPRFNDCMRKREAVLWYVIL
tara:strand:+ start:367 stop:516 length:150 start_codon:yes stop_codon:yes gene_type:complete